MLSAVVVAALAVHLLLANLAAGGPLVCVWLKWRARRHGDPSADRVGRRLARQSLAALVLAAATGGILLGLAAWRDDSAFWNAAAALKPLRWWFAGLEFAFSLGCLAAYAWLWDRPGWRLLHPLLGFLAATNLLYHFPALFTVVASLAARGVPLVTASITSADYRRLLLEPPILATVLHVWLASLAVAGVALLHLAARDARRDGSPSKAGLLGARLALAATVLQLPTGAWLTMALPTPARSALLGSNATMTGLFAASMVLAAFLLHQLATAALGEIEQRRARLALITTGVLTLCMTGVLHRVQHPPRPANSAGAASLP